MIYELYQIENIINHKKYIGITTWGYKKRFTRHKSDAKRGDSRPLYASMRKHGVDNFTITPLESTTTWKKLCKLEVKYIDERNSFIDNGQGYNLTLGGEGTPGRILSEEHKRKILETKNKWSEKKKQEVRNKQSSSVKEYWDNASPNQILERNKKVSVGRKNHLLSRSKEVADKINESIRNTLQQNPSKRRTCTIDGIEYFSQSEASRQLNIPVATLGNRLKSKKYPNYINGKLHGN